MHKVIIVVVLVMAVNIYVAAVQVLSENERQDETEFTTKTMVFLSLPSLNANVLLACFFSESHPLYDRTQRCCVFLTLRLTLIFDSFLWLQAMRLQIIWSPLEFLAACYFICIMKCTSAFQKQTWLWIIGLGHMVFYPCLVASLLMLI